MELEPPSLVRQSMMDHRYTDRAHYETACQLWRNEKCSLRRMKPSVLQLLRGRLKTHRSLVSDAWEPSFWQSQLGLARGQERDGPSFSSAWSWLVFAHQSSKPSPFINFFWFGNKVAATRSLASHE